MSLLPDRREDSKLIIPANTQRNLASVLKLLFNQHPELGKFTGSCTTLWEDNFEITPQGADFLVDLIHQSNYQPVESLSDESLVELFEETLQWPTEQILRKPKVSVCGCLGSISDLQRKLGLCNCAFGNYVYRHRDQLIEYRRQNLVY